MFAGPNGSGKSTLREVLPRELLGIYINPDEIEHGIRARGYLDLNTFGITTDEEAVLRFFQGSSFLQKAGLSGGVARMSFASGKLVFAGVEVNAYFASVAADFVRRELLERKVTFTFETVMSSPDKVTLLEKAKRIGYRTYLYYIATEDPQINISRVRNRVNLGGHPVPEDKIVSRYHRSLDLLMEAIYHTDRAYVFDNSGHNKEKTWLAEITGGKVLEMKANEMPAWFKRAVLDKINPPTS
jgi:predicted ABC-type ATPase